MAWWEKVKKLVGLPDYAVAFALWPWPDGGWMAGIALTDLDYATEQGMAPRVLALAEHHDPTFSIFDGFTGGINEHGSNAEEAIEKLWEAVWR